MTIPVPDESPCVPAELLTPSMLPAHWPSAGRECRNKALRCFGPHRQFGHSDRQPGRVLDPDILDVHAGLANRGEQPGQLTGPVVDDDLDGGERPRRSAALPGDPRDPGPAPVQDGREPVP